MGASPEGADGRMAVLRDGVVEQVGDPRTIYRAPANRFVADFIGETNWLSAEVVSAGPEEIRHLLEVRQPLYRQVMRAEIDVTSLAPDEAVAAILKYL